MLVTLYFLVTFFTHTHTHLVIVVFQCILLIIYSLCREWIPRIILGPFMKNTQRSKLCFEMFNLRNNSSKGLVSTSFNSMTLKFIERFRV